jgi:hypothetical protein
MIHHVIQTLFILLKMLYKYLDLVANYNLITSKLVFFFTTNLGSSNLSVKSVEFHDLQVFNMLHDRL